MTGDARTDVYQDHAEPDAPQQELNSLDSAVDVLIASAALVQSTDEV